MDYYKEELSNEIVHTIEEDTLGNIWVGTQDGLVCIPSKSNRSMIRSYGIKEGLPNSLILNIKKDNDGNLWITTGNGLSMMEITTKNFHNYTTANGLATSECNRNHSACHLLENLYSGRLKDSPHFTLKRRDNLL